jgi:hypothetical protein
MKEKVVRIRIPEEVYKRYKILCVQKDLSIPRQTEALITHFVEMLTQNKEYIKNDSDK